MSQGGAFYWKGIKTGRIYQFVGAAVPNNFIDAYGRPLNVITDYHSPDGEIETVVYCLPYGGVQPSTAGPLPIDPITHQLISYNPGLIPGPWDSTPQE